MQLRPSQRPVILDLYTSTWPSLRQGINLAENLGWHWWDITSPQVAWDEEVAVSHVGVLEAPMLVNGQETSWAGIHAVCTHPTYRKMGKNRPLMEAALNLADRHECSFLTTEQPELYQRYGFVVVPETRWNTQARCGGATPGRPLNHDPADILLLHRILANRAAVTHTLTALDSGWMVAFNEILETGGIRRMYHIEDLDCVVVYALHGSRLLMLDILAEQVPTLSTLAPHLPASVTHIELAFGPELVAPSAKPTPSNREDGTYFMVRGPHRLPDAVAMPMLNRC